jgi:hypothetical protein
MRPIRDAGAACYYPGVFFLDSARADADDQGRDLRQSDASRTQVLDNGVWGVTSPLDRVGLPAQGSG